MKKVRWFTLVEMLIVIVIIGILIAVFAPKLTGTQSTARDTGRKANLQTVGAALIKYQLDEGNYPTSGGSLSNIWIDEYLDYKTPTDPQNTRTVSNCNMGETDPGQYMYVPLKKNGLNGGGFALIASVEEPWAANRVMSPNEWGPRGCIEAETDYWTIAKAIPTCDKIRENNPEPNCNFDPSTDTLRHVYVQ